MFITFRVNSWTWISKAELKEKSESVSCLIVSNSLQLHGLQPIPCNSMDCNSMDRFLCPWNSPGKNTGLGSHSLLQGNLPDPGMEPWSPVLQADSLLCEALGTEVKWSGSVVSDSLQSHGLLPTQAPPSMGFPGKNTGVSCHFLLY